MQKKPMEELPNHIIISLPSDYASSMEREVGSEEAGKYFDFAAAVRAESRGAGISNLVIDLYGSAADKALAVALERCRKRKWQNTIPQQFKPKFRYNRPQTSACYSCGVRGHFVRECPKGQKEGPKYRPPVAGFKRDV